MALSVAGVALGDIDLRVAWQAWSCSNQPSFCVAGVALMTLGWIWWCAWAPLVARGAAALCVAGGALGDLDLGFCVAGVALMTLDWIWWRAWAPIVARGARGALCGRRGTWRHRPSCCMAGVALAHINLRFAWQAWRI